VPPHWPSLEQVATHALFTQDRLPPSPQSALVTHCTQVFDVVSQCRTTPPPPNMQFVSDVHCTHIMAVVSHTGVGLKPPPVTQLVLVVHERTHVPAAVLQTRVPESPQSAVVAHCTHLPADEHMRPPPPAPAQFVFERHATHTPALPQ
jgi:hypothetical protein